MDPVPRPPPNFALPGFAGLVDLVMEEQGLDRDAALEVLILQWAQEGAGGVQPWQPNDLNNTDRDNPHRGLSPDPPQQPQPQSHLLRPQNSPFLQKNSQSFSTLTSSS
ncbi:hypothetical protein J3R83DRAFT_9455 [Lanmaoa asiatica]|nr:hypothetical protein J3R83DRAFT_9455 [Lanmaoa asiatica]